MGLYHYMSPRDGAPIGEHFALDRDNLSAVVRR
jgi:hypothetical protein